jgi:hypothetical protein
MNDYYASQFVGGVVFSTTRRKQEIGQRLASHLSFIPGPSGADGSVDGAITNVDGNLIAHFQSKLSANPLDLSEAKNLHSDLMRLKPKVCVYVAGVGYQDSFYRLIQGQADISHVDIHLITLVDVFSTSEKYQEVIRCIPVHAGGPIDFSLFRI